MKKDRHIIFNYRLVGLMLSDLLILLFCIGGVCYPENDEKIASWIMLIIVAIAFIAIPIFEPHCCIITAEGIAIHYGLGLKEKANWNDIRKIRVSSVSTGEFSMAKAYEFQGIKGSKAYFMNGKFYKSKKLTKLIRIYAPRFDI